MPIDQSHNVSLYTLGKGVLSIGEWAGTTPPASYVDVGNCPKFDCEVTEALLDHFSSRQGTKTKDKTVVIEVGYNLTFDLDEVSVKNLQMFLKATLSGGNVLLANTALQKEYAVKFVSDNPAGPNETWIFHRCQLSPGGALSLIGDAWMAMSFKGSGLADVANHPTSPYFTVTFHTTTTTTATTTTAP